MDIDKVLVKARNQEPFSPSELEDLLDLPPTGTETLHLMAAANQLSRELQGNEAEIHGQLALNLAPCPEECQFCSFAKSNKVFTRATEVSAAEAVAMARAFERDGCQAVLVMTTANFSFHKFSKIIPAIREALRPETPLVANVGDAYAEHAEEMRAMGICGVYHALRLGEGKDTNIIPKRRLRSMELFRAAGLQLGTCVEPIGPEHSNREIAEMIRLTADLEPVFSGAARRIPIPGTDMAARGMVPEIRQAQVVAITRLAMPHRTVANCTHEPGTLPAIGGASFFWAEMGANPRDTREKTEEGRGHNIQELQNMFWETGWQLRQGPSRIWREA
jgi:biotin synthase